jgi:hypothetical protein
MRDIEISSLFGAVGKNTNDSNVPRVGLGVVFRPLGVHGSLGPDVEFEDLDV